jgi:hypothetical protein
MLSAHHIGTSSGFSSCSDPPCVLFRPHLCQSASVSYVTPFSSHPGTRVLTKRKLKLHCGNQKRKTDSALLQLCVFLAGSFFRMSQRSSARPLQIRGPLLVLCVAVLATSGAVFGDANPAVHFDGDSIRRITVVLRGRDGRCDTAYIDNAIDVAPRRSPHAWHRVNGDSLLALQGKTPFRQTRRPQISSSGCLLCCEARPRRSPPASSLG